MPELKPKAIYAISFDHKKIAGDHDLWSEDCFCVPNIYYSILQPDDQGGMDMRPKGLEHQLQ